MHPESADYYRRMNERSLNMDPENPEARIQKLCIQTRLDRERHLNPPVGFSMYPQSHEEHYHADGRVIYDTTYVYYRQRSFSYGHELDQDNIYKEIHHDPHQSVWPHIVHLEPGDMLDVQRHEYPSEVKGINKVEYYTNFRFHRKPDIGMIPRKDPYES